MMADPATLVWLVEHATYELALFAAVGIILGGVDDLMVDLIWIVRGAWLRLRHGRKHAPVLDPVAVSPVPIAVFVPAWQEAEVIGPMLANALARWRDEAVRIYVGVYPNDRATRRALAGFDDPRVRVVINPRQGPTTKADNLNALWAALERDDPGRRFAAVVLHDAEDVVHSAELRVFAALIDRYDLVQLPVLPLIARDRGRWAEAVSATYADEFAEGHGKQLVVREAIGAALPLAGVGCAIRRDMLASLAARHGAPFDASSLTEDYELGLRTAETGGRGTFAHFVLAPGGPPIAVRAHFPDSVEAAVRQKARWQTGIALSGWERLGWSGGIAERWMRLRDRRAMVSALVISAAYLSTLGWLGLRLLDRGAPVEPVMTELFTAGLTLLGWRMLLRITVIGRLYGWREGLGTIPRLLLANLIAVAAARRALMRFLALMGGGPVQWDKTSHRFPDAKPAE
jgi:adsorption protein B